jgi:TolA-binding protein/DNA-binding beta-propeller fold protein YncE
MTPPRPSRYLPALLCCLLLLPPGAAAQDGGLVQKLYETALQLLRGGKSDEALKGFEQIYDSYGSAPQAPDALYQAASYHYPVTNPEEIGSASRDNIQKASALLERIRKHYGGSARAPDALYKMGLLALEPENPKFSPDEAYAAFTALANVYPNSPLVGEALYGAATSQMRSGAYDAALEDFARLLEQVPSFPGAARARLDYGYSLYRTGDYPRAMEEYQKIRDLYPAKSEAQAAKEKLTLLHRLRLIPATGRSVAYAPDASFSGRLETLGLRSVSSMAIGPDGGLLVADAKQGVAVVIDPKGRPGGKIAFPDAESAAVDRRGGPVVAGGGNLLSANKQQPLVRSDSATPRPVRETSGVGVGRDGRIYVGDAKTNEVLLFGRGLDFRTSVYRSAGGKLGSIRVGFDNQIYVLDARDKSVTVLQAGKTMSRIRVGDAPASLSAPADLAIDELGDLYVADPGTGRVMVLDPSGKKILSTLGPDRGKGGISAPERIEVDRQGRIYVYDRKSDAILRYQ